MSDQFKSSNQGPGRRYLPRRDVIRSCACAECGAPIGEACARARGGVRARVHKSRYELAELLNA
jgi:hypothetical protein